MARLKHYQRDLIQGFFSPQPGYVLDFTNKTFSEFFEDHFETRIYADAFSEKGTSKFNRLLSFIELSPPHVVVELLRLLWKRKHADRDASIEEAAMQSSRNEWAVDPEYVSILMDSAAIEDAPLYKLIDEIAALPSHTVLPHLKRVSAEWTLDTLEREFQRAFEGVDNDPEAAITAACSMLEGICKSSIDARGLDRPKTQDIKTLYKCVREPLGLAAEKEMPSGEIEADVRTVLSALANVVQGIGALRTHAGSAHGRERGFRRLDPRIARLSVSSASSIALFLLETWEKRFPEDKLVKIASKP
ncbi:abortive infection family protein [Sagittula sp. S175]|uniref:abortive infection family protein n=1 Tax=Sagittula sp. S175 TaxID=3415129 RepID=UPI003C7AAC0D